MPEHEASQTPYNPFDLTKVWPHGDYPLIDVGYFELNRNPETTSLKWNNPHSIQLTLSLGSVSPQTACYKAACSHTVMPPAIV